MKRPALPENSKEFPAVFSIDKTDPPMFDEGRRLCGKVVGASPGPCELVTVSQNFLMLFLDL